MEDGVREQAPAGPDVEAEHKPIYDDGNGVPLSVVVKAGHRNEWTVVLRSTSADRVQILCVSPETISRSGAAESLTPLHVCEQVAALVMDAVKDSNGPCKGQHYLSMIRELASAARERILAESAESVQPSA